MRIMTYFRDIDELTKNTWLTAVAFGASNILLFVCIFRVSNATALVILAGAGVIGFVSIVTSSYWRFAVVAAAACAVALELIIHEEASALFIFSVLARFITAGLLITFFASLLANMAHRIYLNVEQLAMEREAYAVKMSRWLERGNALLAVMSAISTRTRLQEVLTSGLEEARKVFNADSGLIYSLDQETGRLSIAGSFGYSPDILNRMKRKWKRRGDVSTCLACQRKRAVVVDDLATDEKCEDLSRVESGSSICIPITGGNGLWGVMHLRRANPAAFSGEDLQLAQAITYQFGLAMQRSALFEQVDRLAVTDPITGLYNYRKLTRDMGREILRSSRYHHPFSFIMADVDYFKRINDENGHLAGDEVLRAVSRVLLGGSREVDRVYRYAGDEFAILLPETDLGDALELAEKLRGDVAEMQVSPEGAAEPIGITLSAGVAAFTGGDLQMKDMVAAADGALYEAKQGGRNRVVAHGGS